MNKPTLHIIKIGGHIINDSTSLAAFLVDFSALKGPKILIHGGGNKATEVAKQMGLSSEMIGGRRITNEANLEVETMVYAGLINKKIVAQLQGNDCNALGLSGADANIIKAHKRPVNDIDYGFAGDIDKIDTAVIQLLLEQGISPVFSAITHNKKGQLLNTNADTIASEIAAALTDNYQVILTYCFDKKGVLKNISDEDSVIEKINTKLYLMLQEDHSIANGMLPKLFNCFYALNQGVSKVIIGKPSVIINKDQLYTTLSL